MEGTMPRGLMRRYHSGEERRGLVVVLKLLDRRECVFERRQ